MTAVASAAAVAVMGSDDPDYHAAYRRLFTFFVAYLACVFGLVAGASLSDPRLYWTAPSANDLGRRGDYPCPRHVRRRVGDPSAVVGPIRRYPGCHRAGRWRRVRHESGVNPGLVGGFPTTSAPGAEVGGCVGGVPGGSRNVAGDCPFRRYG